MATGYLGIFLHAHLPFVRHPENARHLEEDWLFEAITETYIPLLDVFNRLDSEGVQFRLAMSITPPLAEMLSDPLLRARYVEHLDRLIALSSRELSRTQFVPQFHDLARMYHDKFTWCRRFFDEWYGRDLLSGFRHYQDTGRLEIVTCNGTHGFLPALRENPQSVRAQLKQAVRSHKRHFGRNPNGIWLAECGYYEGLEDELARNGIGYFFTDTHGILFGAPPPRFGVYAPVITNAGPACFARDPESSRAVWSAETGYPGDPDYREFYRDIGFDLDEEYLADMQHMPGLRANTGIKYYRITGKGKAQEPYNPRAAFLKASQHAQDFVDNRRRQAEWLGRFMDRPPLLLAPYDAELFGHWWYEGPEFLYFVFKKLHFDQREIEPVRPSDYLEWHPVNQKLQPAFSTWGHMGYADVWLNGTNDWIYPHLHAAADQMKKIAERYPDAWGDYRRALNQMARELFLAQSSDWAFIMRTGTSVQYAVQRTREHLVAFQKLHDILDAGGQVPVAELELLEKRDNIFPDADYRDFL